MKGFAVAGMCLFLDKFGRLFLHCGEYANHPLRLQLTSEPPKDKKGVYIDWRAPVNYVVCKVDKLRDGVGGVKNVLCGSVFFPFFSINLICCALLRTYNREFVCCYSNGGWGV